MHATKASPRVRLRHRVEYGLFYVLVALPCRIVPYRVMLVYAAGWAWLFFNVIRFRRRETCRRISEVFPGLPRRRVRAIAWISLRNLAFNIVEMMRIDRFSADYLARHIENSEETLAAIRAARGETDAPTGLLIGLPHSGNWDLAACALSRAGFATITISARQRNPLTNDWLIRVHKAFGMTIVERGVGGLHQIMRELRSGAILSVTQDTRMRTPELSIPFLGKTANLGRGLSTFAWSLGLPVLPVYIERVGWTHFRLRLFPLIRPEPGADKRSEQIRITTLVAQRMEQAIRDAPEQWFWYNRRWVLDPLPAPKENAHVETAPQHQP